MFYHNLTSKYNAYFLARERMKELETDLYKAQKTNYNRILEIYPKIDTVYAKSVKDKLDKIIKNASIPIQWHKVSHWVDDSYIVIGKCRYYDVDWENAITTFRFIISRYEDPEVKHLAAIWLMRVYMEQKNWDGARNQADFLESEFLSPSNVAGLSLANGHYYLKQNDLKNAYEKLKIGADYIKPKDYRARVFYVIAQLAQKLNEDKQALAYYKKCDRLRPEYEMQFHARLNLYQMKELKSEKDAKKTLRYYRKLLKDIKNKDYKDKIYYEIATFHQKREVLDSAIRNYKNAAKAAKSNPFTKAMAFLRIADIHYDNQQEYEKASTYYDSTVAILEKDLPEYPRAYKRQRILKEFVEKIKIVRKEDSLQKLSRMDSTELAKLVDKWIADEQKRLREEEKAKKLAERNAQINAINANNTLDPLAANFSDKWYFYNQVTVENGKNEFNRKWGQRPLEDNWRRSNKEKDMDATLGASIDTTNKRYKDLQEDEITLNVNEERKKYYKEIPFSKVMLDSSNFRLKNALFRVARIYDFNLEEYPNANKSYTRFIDSFYVDERVPEAMYANYIICKNKKPDSLCVELWKNRLLTEFPKSLYAKLIKNPNYLVENQLLGEKVKAQYRRAFELYESNNFLAAQNAVVASMLENPENEYTERFILLRAMIVGRTQSVKSYQDSLTRFIKTYEKTSKLVPFAKDLLAKANALMKKDSVALSKNKIVYDLDLNYTHLYVVVVNDKEAETKLVESFNIYNKDFFTDQNFKTKLLPWENDTKLLVIQPFPNSIQGLNYYDKQSGVSSPLKPYFEKKFTQFVISKRNFDIMISGKSHDSYIEFFKRNYLKL